MKALNIRSLSFGAKASICWSFLWRGIFTTFASALTGGILGGILGFLVAIAGVPRDSAAKLIQIGGFGLGALAGVAFIYLYVRWLLSSQLGKYRLILVRAGDASGRPGHAPDPDDA